MGGREGDGGEGGEGEGADDEEGVHSSLGGRVESIPVGPELDCLWTMVGWKGKEFTITITAFRLLIYILCQCFLFFLSFL